VGKKKKVKNIQLKDNIKNTDKISKANIKSFYNISRDLSKFSAGFMIGVVFSIVAYLFLNAGAYILILSANFVGRVPPIYFSPSEDVVGQKITRVEGAALPIGMWLHGQGFIAHLDNGCSFFMSDILETEAARKAGWIR
jgi:hypothetical protein